VRLTAKVLYVGHLSEGQTSRMRMEAMKNLGFKIFPVDVQSLWASNSMILRQMQQRISFGTTVDRINEEIVKIIKAQKIDVLWCDKQEFIKPKVLKECKQLGILSIHYTPDPYFTLSWKQTRLSKESMPLYDVLLTSKTYELDQYKKMNPRSFYVPLGFSESVHRPCIPDDEKIRNKYSCDISFIGGWEPRREEYLNAISKVSHNFKIWGYAWDHLQDGKVTLRRYIRLKRLAGKEKFVIKKNLNLCSLIQGGEIYGDEYARAISCSKISVGFLRTICPDQHTTRTFEIPACGSMLLADRTMEHQEFFKEGVEADFFSSQEELIDKAQYYLKNESARKALAKAGYKRCFASGYSYEEILKRFLGQIVKEMF
jgi:spore maturation protein CgeB